VFPSNNSLADQLKMVARMVSTAAELGVADRVTTFTASAFGRTFTGTDGSDHGWGGTHLILGGAVNGGRFYGIAPVIANNGPDDVGQGRRLPSTSVDQYAAALGRWFGIGDTDLLGVLPNLGRWDVGVRGVGFVKGYGETQVAPEPSTWAILLWP
jgi:uncharacterized protein (DUF1501 family)